MESASLYTTSHKKTHTSALRDLATRSTLFNSTNLLGQTSQFDSFNSTLFAPTHIFPCYFSPIFCEQTKQREKKRKRSSSNIHNFSLSPNLSRLSLSRSLSFRWEMCLGIFMNKLGSSNPFTLTKAGVYAWNEQVSLLKSKQKIQELCKWRAFRRINFE